MQGEFTAGDCVITKHSNLRALHLLFHCVVDTVAADRWTWSRAEHAEAVAPCIGRAVQFCCAQGVQSLAVNNPSAFILLLLQSCNVSQQVPALCCDGAAKVSAADAAEALAATLKALRSAFVEFSQQSHVTFLREVHVLLPHAVVQMLGKDAIGQLISRTILQ